MRPSAPPFTLRHSQSQSKMTKIKHPELTSLVHFAIMVITSSMLLLIIILNSSVGHSSSLLSAAYSGDDTLQQQRSAKLSSHRRPPSKLSLHFNNHNNNNISPITRATASGSSSKWFVAGFTLPINHRSQAKLSHYYGGGGRLLTNLFDSVAGEQFGSDGDGGYSSSGSDGGDVQLEVQANNINNKDEQEREKMKYLTLAKEAHSKFFSDQISQEEYVNLALRAWNEAYSGNDSGNVGGGGYEWLSVNEDAAVSQENNSHDGSGVLNGLQSSPPILKGASSSDITTNNYSADVTTTTTASTSNKLPSKQIMNSGSTSKIKSSAPLFTGKTAGGSVKILPKKTMLDLKKSVTTKQQLSPSSMIGDKGQFSTLQQQKKKGATIIGATTSAFQSKFPSNSSISKDNSGSNLVEKGDDIKQPLPKLSYTQQSDTQPSTLSVDTSSYMSNKPLEVNGLQSSTLKLGVSKGQSSSPTMSKGVSPNSAVGKQSSSFVSKSSSPLKGSDTKSSFSKISSSPPPPPPPRSSPPPKSTNDDNRSNSNINPFELFGGLGTILFGKSKRPSPSTSLVGGLGMLNDYEEDDVPYGLRVGKGGSVNDVASDDVASGDASSGGGVVKKGLSVSTPAMMSKGEQEMGTSNGSAVGQMAKKVALKGGGQIQPPMTKTSVTPQTPAAFKKGMVGSKIGKEVSSAKKMSVPIQKGSTLITKSSLQPPSPSSIPNEINTAKASPQSSVLKSIDKNKEEILQTKTWIENEKRLEDVRKKAAAIQGTTVKRGGNLQSPFVTKEREDAAIRGESIGKESDESTLNLLPKKSNIAADEIAAEKAAVEIASTLMNMTAGKEKDSPAVAANSIENNNYQEEDVNESIDDWIQEQNRMAQERTAARMVQEKRAKQEEAFAVVTAMEEETRLEEMTAKNSDASVGGLVVEKAEAVRQAQLDELKPIGTTSGEGSAEEAKARVAVEAKDQGDRRNEAMKQPNAVSNERVMKLEKPRSEQIPNGEYWLAEQNRLVEERRRARLEEEATTRTQLKGSDNASGFQQPVVPPKKMSVSKRVEVSSAGGGMYKSSLSKQSVKKQQPFMEQRPKTDVQPAVSSTPPKISTTLRASAESKMIEKGYIPFQGTTAGQRSDMSPNLPVVPANVPNVQQVTPMIPINKIEPSEASQMIAPTMQKEASESRSLDLAAAEALAGSLDDIDVSSLPAIRVGNRIRSSMYGTTHQVLLILPNDDGEFEILPCVAKRPWTIAELYANVPSKVAAFEEQQSESAFDELVQPEYWEVDYKAKSVRRYWEVEIHCNKKFQQKKELYKRLQLQALNDEKQAENDGGESKSSDEGVSFAIRVADVAIPKFYDVYPDDGSGGTNEDDVIPEYGLFGQDVWNKTIEFGHDWLVYESKLGVNELTLLDAMTMQHEINKQFLEDGYQVHHLYGIQQAMKLPDSFGFGDVLDVIIRSLLENIAFLASCNVVHRNLNPSNLICDEDNGRLRVINFGDAVDLDPKETVRVGLDNDTLESNAPGAIANSLAADVFSVALVVCELLFDFDEATFTAQIKEVGYDLDAWLQRTLTAEERPLGLDEALWYLSERRGLWALLKSMIKPNPLRRKITSASLQQFNEIIALKDGKIEETDQVLAGGDEAYLNSVLFQSGSDSGSVQIPPSSRNALNDSYDDIPQTQYTSTLPRASQASSVLSELAEQINADAEQIQGTREEGPNSNPKMQNPAHTTSASNTDTYNDITRATFTPARASKLTAMLAPKSREPISQKRQSLPEQQSGNYYDITRASFERVSPQPMALTASQLYSILRESGAAGVPPQFHYDMVQSGYIPEANFEQSGYRGNNIVLPQRAISANLPRGYVPAQPTESISQEAYEEVEQWLLSCLPRLQKADVSNYCWSLIDEGFDSAEMLKELEFDDLHFMKKAHRRALVKVLSKGISSLPEKVNAPKKVYKVEEALGEAARKGIEALVAASKSEQTPDERKKVLDRFKAYEAKIAAEKAETERKIAEAQNRMQSEIRAREEEDRELKELQDKIEADLQMKAKEEQRLRELEKEMDIRAKALEEKERQELHRLRELEKEMEMQQIPIESEKSVQEETTQQVSDDDESSIQTDTKWVEEQNRLIKERNNARMAQERETASRKNEVESSAVSSEKTSRLTSIIADASDEILPDESQMIRNNESNKPTQQRQDQDKEKRVINNDGTRDDWYAEQNRLVEERRKARLAKEGKKE